MIKTVSECDIKAMLEKALERVEKFDTEKGGIYVETTEDFRGWMLGDNTRKIYKVSNPCVEAFEDVKVLTDVFVGIIPKNNDGSEIRVLVYNPRDTARMLLCKNDDVGSSVEYAHIEPPKPTELIANIGTHVCIESLTRGSWIRVQVFPGSDILKTINSGEVDVSKLLEAEQMEIKEVLAELVSKYVDMEKDIDALLSRLERHGMICNCDDPTKFKQIFQGKFDEIIQTCISCGGTIEN